MAKQKWECHICRNSSKLPDGTPYPEVCPVCATSLANRSEEMERWTASVEKQAGGIREDVVVVSLTNKRLIFRGQNVGGTGALLGGLVGMAIESAVKAGKTNLNIAWLPIEDVSSISSEVAGLFKGKVMTSVHAKDGKIYTMKLSKKGFENFQAQISPMIGR
ncbi:MAG: hypothetical protein FWD97_09290 [Defluviitaleaceae bacterium]|nr:hypothetical protein [Defluviitaleaceae bacterium]